jgi:hypothetical protein
MSDFANPLNLTGDALITAERWRVMASGRTIEHDIEHSSQELVQAALCYLDGGLDWPWPGGYTLGPHRINDLVRAGQLIAAAIDVELARGS